MSDIIAAGTYQAKAKEAALGETSTGKEQVAIRFELEGLGTSMTWYGYFTEKTTESTFKALRTAGWHGQDLSDLSDLSRPDVPVVNLVVEHETDEKGATRARVRWINSTGGIGIKSALPADKAKAFAAKMRGALVAFDKSAGAPKPRPVETTPHELLEKQADEQGEALPF